MDHHRTLSPRLGEQPSLVFEGRAVPFLEGDTVASALYRAGVRVFSRSFKYHRPRGLYCLTGDCPNCLLTIGGEPAVRSCATRAVHGQQIARGRGWPSTSHDVWSLLWYARRLLPVGFYYKSMGRPAWLWARVEPLIRAITGLGPVDVATVPTDRDVLHLHPQDLVIGGGFAGLSAALAASDRGRSVLLVDEGRIGENVVSSPARATFRALHDAIVRRAQITVLEEAAAIGIYEGPQVPVNTRDRLTIVWPRRIIVATGAVDLHPVFANNDLPGIWLGRGAEILATRHALKPGKRAVVVGDTDQTPGLIDALESVGTEIVAVICRSGTPAVSAKRVVAGQVARALGRTRLRGVAIATADGVTRIRCDALVVSAGFVPRDSLLRQSGHSSSTGAGEVISPGCSVDAAIESGRRAGSGESTVASQSDIPVASHSGFVCLCEDVECRDIAKAWGEGFTSSELLKRYTTSGMGPCQGALCQAHLRAAVDARTPLAASSPATTARPPARPLKLEDAAAGRRFDLQHRTALHARHLALGATMERAGAWMRPESYGDTPGEYAAVRDRVSLMDVGTLGKFLVGGPDAAAFLEHLYPCRVADLEEGRVRYALLLNEAGHVTDDGMICALPGDRYYVTFTSGGAEHAEAWMRYWVHTLKLDVYILNETASRGAINLAGPLARRVLAELTADDVLPAAFPFMRVRSLLVGDVPCIVIRLGFVGELSYELHHLSGHSELLWDSILAAGATEGIAPHGLETLRLLRLEKGHIIIGQDTDFDSGPRNLGLDFAVNLSKASFVGKPGVLRNLETPLYQRLTPLRFPDGAPPEGAVLLHDTRPVGHLTSSRMSPSLGCGVALGWLRASDGVFPELVHCADGTVGHRASTPFYDPEGVRLRG